MSTYDYHESNWNPSALLESTKEQWCVYCVAWVRRSLHNAHILITMTFKIMIIISLMMAAELVIQCVGVLLEQMRFMFSSAQSPTL